MQGRVQYDSTMLINKQAGSISKQTSILVIREIAVLPFSYYLKKATSESFFKC